MSDKIVMITDETDICYGMLGKVIAEGNGLRACYQLLITGYENCIKAGYSDKDIKDHNLDERGFLYLISKTNCRVMTNKEMAVVYMNEIVTVDDLMQFPLSHCLNGENVDKAAVEAYKVRTAELLGVNLIQSTRCFREAKIPQGDVIHGTCTTGDICGTLQSKASRDMLKACWSIFLTGMFYNSNSSSLES